MKPWNDIGFKANGVVNLTPSESFLFCKEGAVIVDVREPHLIGFRRFNAESILYHPYSTLENTFSSLPPDRLLIFADTVGLRSRDAVVLMNEYGFRNAVNMAGGIVDWERDGLPVSKDVSKRLSGSCMCQLKPRENHKE